MPRVLVVDDDAQIRRLFRMALEGEGYEVHEAGDGVAALSHFAEIRPELVITDVMMPEKDGLETILEIRRAAPQARILAVSGGGQLNVLTCLVMARNLGADAVLAKPVQVNALLDIVRQLFERPCGEGACGE
ncbi:MAG: response regulator [FCB group bacterium]|jgi:DNA-binding response OmpR family regulator|nr:response regulator [FCB group bacterium]